MVRTRDETKGLAIEAAALERVWNMQRVRVQNLVRRSIYNEYSGSIKIATHLDHISHCKASSGSNWSN